MSSRESNPAEPLVEPLVEPLTRREREILALLAQGYSGPKIAERLTLALSSVKWHIQHLYGKLGVNSKRQALTRARALGLLATSPPSALSEPQSTTATAFQATRSGQPLPPGRPSPAHNLPVQLTRFFGREPEIAQVKERLAEWRLVTLTGSGGVGKTRLSLQVAEAVLDDFSNGVWLVELAPLSDPALVAQQVASSLGLRDEPGRPILDSLSYFLRERRVLLVLDNCEHLLEACARLADVLLRACPRLRLLASSREPLGIAGEAVFHVPSLPFPDPDHLPSLERLDEYTALSLFVDRARAVQPDYQVAAHNAAVVARICQRLDGIPLALELAAACIHVLNTETLAARLDDVFRVLTGGSRTALPRHQTLRATIDWSYSLLSETERLLLQRPSVFAGGCTLEAAEAVCSGEGLEAGEILDRLAGLVDKSMVIADRQPGEATRYRLLEMVRQYARDKLQARKESRRLHRRHRDYFLQFAEANVPKLSSRDRLVWTRKFETERENLRLALEWSFTDETDVEAGPRLFIAMDHGPFAWQEKADWCNRVIAWCLSHAQISAAVYASLLGHATHIVMVNDPQTALAMANQVVEISRRLDPEGKQTLVEALFNLAHLRISALGEVEKALAPLAEAEALFQELGPDKFPPKEYLERMADFARIKARIALYQGQYGDAKLHARESIRLWKEAGNPWGSFSPQRDIGITCLNLAEYDQAREHFLEALDLADEMKDAWAKALSRSSLGTAEYELGNLDQALEYYKESLRQAEQIPDRNIIASCLAWCARISAKQGQPARAAVLSAAAQALYKKQNREPWEDSSLDTLLPGWRDGPDHDAISKAYEASEALSDEQAVAYALGDLMV